MKKGLAVYAVLAYAFLHVPLLILAIFSFNSSRFAVWEKFSLQWYRAVAADANLIESSVNSLIIAVAATLAASVIGTLAAYGLWKRGSGWLSGIWVGWGRIAGDRRAGGARRARGAIGGASRGGLREGS